MMKIGHKEILLIEDNENDAELALKALKKVQLSEMTYHVKDGQEALDFIFDTNQLLQGQNIRMIFLDLKLPKISGAEVLTKLKSDSRTKSIPVIILTSSQQLSDLLDCYKHGANSYIVKPIDFEEFVTSVSSAGKYWITINKTVNQGA